MNLLYKRIALLLCVAFIVAATLAAPAASGGDYSVVVLGDLHYDGDAPEKFHGEYLKTLKGAKPKRLDEFKRNSVECGDDVQYCIDKCSDNDIYSTCTGAVDGNSCRLSHSTLVCIL